jgi:hypothetical protein
VNSTARHDTDIELLWRRIRSLDASNKALAAQVALIAAGEGMKTYQREIDLPTFGSAQFCVATVGSVLVLLADSNFLVTEAGADGTSVTLLWQGAGSAANLLTAAEGGVANIDLDAQLAHANTQALLLPINHGLHTLIDGVFTAGKVLVTLAYLSVDAGATIVDHPVL